MLLKYQECYCELHLYVCIHAINLHKLFQDPVYKIELDLLHQKFWKVTYKSCAAKHMQSLSHQVIEFQFLRAGSYKS